MSGAAGGCSQRSSSPSSSCWSAPPWSPRALGRRRRLQRPLAVRRRAVFNDFGEAEPEVARAACGHARPSCSSACAARAPTHRPTCWSRPTSRTSGAPRRPGMLQASPPRRSRPQVPAELPRPRRGSGGGSALRIRTPMRSTERVPARTRSPATRTSATRSSRGRTCLRTSNNEYNQSSSPTCSPSAAAARHGGAAASRGWTTSRTILNSDVDVLAAIAAGDCDVGLTNHYYLGRSSRRTRASPSRRHGPTRTAPVRTPTCRASGVVAGSEAPSRRGRADRVPHRPPAQEEIVATASSPPTPTCRRPSTSGSGPTSSSTRSPSSRPGRSSTTPSR